MKSYKLYSLLLLICCSFLFSSTASAQFITIARKMKSKLSGSTDVATVTLDVKTNKVYGAVIDTLTSNKKFVIAKRDDAKRFVGFTTGAYKVSMQVDSVAASKSKMTVSAAHSDDSEKQAVDIAVNAVMAVCKKLGLPCTCESAQKK